MQAHRSRHALGAVAALAATGVLALAAIPALTGTGAAADAFEALQGDGPSAAPVPAAIADEGPLRGRSVESSASTPLPGGGVAYLLATDDDLLCVTSMADLGPHEDMVQVSCDKASTASRDGMHSGLFAGEEGRALAVFPDGYADSLSASGEEGGGGQGAVARTEVANLVAVDEEHLRAALRSGTDRVTVRAEGDAGSMAVEIPIAVKAEERELD